MNTKWKLKVAVAYPETSICLFFKTLATYREVFERNVVSDDETSDESQP